MRDVKDVLKEADKLKKLGKDAEATALLREYTREQALKRSFLYEEFEDVKKSKETHEAREKEIEKNNEIINNLRKEIQKGLDAIANVEVPSVNVTSVPAPSGVPVDSSVPDAPSFGPPDAPDFGPPDAPSFGPPDAPDFGPPNAPPGGPPVGPQGGVNLLSQIQQGKKLKKKEGGDLLSQIKGGKELRKVADPEETPIKAGSRKEERIGKNSSDDDNWDNGDEEADNEAAKASFNPKDVSGVLLKKPVEEPSERSKVVTSKASTFEKIVKDNALSIEKWKEKIRVAKAYKFTKNDKDFTKEDLMKEDQGLMDAQTALITLLEAQKAELAKYQEETLASQKKALKEKVDALTAPIPAPEKIVPETTLDSPEAPKSLPDAPEAPGSLPGEPEIPDGPKSVPNEAEVPDAFELSGFPEAPSPPPPPGPPPSLSGAPGATFASSSSGSDVLKNIRAAKAANKAKKDVKADSEKPEADSVEPAEDSTNAAPAPRRGGGVDPSAIAAQQAARKLTPAEESMTDFLTTAEGTEAVYQELERITGNKIQKLMEKAIADLSEEKSKVFYRQMSELHSIKSSDTQALANKFREINAAMQLMNIRRLYRELPSATKAEMLKVYEPEMERREEILKEKVEQQKRDDKARREAEAAKKAKEEQEKRDKRAKELADIADALKPTNRDITDVSKITEGVKNEAAKIEKEVALEKRTEEASPESFAAKLAKAKEIAAKRMSDTEKDIELEKKNRAESASKKAEMSKTEKVFEGVQEAGPVVMHMEVSEAVKPVVAVVPELTSAKREPVITPTASPAPTLSTAVTADNAIPLEEIIGSAAASVASVLSDSETSMQQKLENIYKLGSETVLNLSGVFAKGGFLAEKGGIITDDLKEISEFLQKHPKITTLDLSSNGIDTTMARQMAFYLFKDKGIKLANLNLGDNDIQDTAVKVLAGYVNRYSPGMPLDVNVAGNVQITGVVNTVLDHLKIGQPVPKATGTDKQMAAEEPVEDQSEKLAAILRELKQNTLDYLSKYEEQGGEKTHKAGVRAQVKTGIGVFELLLTANTQKKYEDAMKLQKKLALELQKPEMNKEAILKLIQEAKEADKEARGIFSKKGEMVRILKQAELALLDKATKQLNPTALDKVLDKVKGKNPKPKNPK